MKLLAIIVFRFSKSSERIGLVSYPELNPSRILCECANLLCNSLVNARLRITGHIKFVIRPFLNVKKERLGVKGVRFALNAGALRDIRLNILRQATRNRTTYIDNRLLLVARIKGC